jgi:hypothetical protein
MSAHGPQDTRLYRLVALLSRPHRRVDLDPAGRRGAAASLFMAAAVALALAILAVAAGAGGRMLLLLPLGSSAYALLRTPMSERSSPRALVGSHAIACAAGLLTWWLSGQIAPGGPRAGLAGFHWRLAIEFAVAAAATGALMVLARCSHAPAIATSALAAWGVLASPQSIAATVGAAALLGLEGIVLLRFLAGLPYPFWTADPSVGRHFGSLAGIPSAKAGYWEQLETRLLRRAS